MDALSPSVSVRSGATTAVVWASRAFAEPRNLLHALAQGGLAVVEVAGQFAALAELMRLERLRRQQQSVGGQLVPPSALVLVYPDQLPEALALLDAVERYAPSVKCWMFGPSTNPRLRPIVEEDRVNGFRIGPAPAEGPSETRTQSVPQVHMRTAAFQTQLSRDAQVYEGVSRGESDGGARIPSRSGGANLRLTGLDRDGNATARFQSDTASADRQEKGNEVIGRGEAPSEDSEAANRSRHLLTTDELRMLLEEPGHG